MLFNKFYAYGYRFSSFTPVEIGIQNSQSKPLEHISCVIEQPQS